MENLETTTKICTECKEEKDLKLFKPQKTGRFGVRSHCRECESKIQK